MPFVSRWSEPAYALLRILAGGMWAMHGGQKIFGAFGGQKAGLPVMQLAGWLEIVLGLMIAAGLLTEIAAFLASGQMAVAYFWKHAPQGLLSPLENKGELAVLYCFVFLYIATRGGGAASLDRAIRRK